MVKPRVVAFAVAVASATCPAMAAPVAQDLLESLGHCAGITDDHARLACYDSLAPHVKEALAAPPASLPGNRHPTAEEERSWFGFDFGGLFESAPSRQTTPQQFGDDRVVAAQAKEDAAAPTVDSITAGVTDIAYTGFDKFIVFLDNGQVWRQIEGDADHAVFRKPANVNKVTISRGMISSYNLSINDSARSYKVTRLK
ncbi:MAG TPA: hypothetical protein VHU23_16710 [Rhizomicrobium sp.]|nr:hypothetical protein [Rhizomicrobium sp.]